MSILPVDASTVMLLRTCPDASVKDIEILMVKRNRRSSFVPGYYVFPGGVVDSGDFDPVMERFVRGLDRATASGILPDMRDPDKTLGAWVAGIRETFEEVGILLAKKNDGSPVLIETEKERRRFCDYRQALAEGRMTFAQMLAEENLLLPLERLHYFSHWITPQILPLRYDVRFFVAELPPRQVVAHDGIELTGFVWIRPVDALRQYESGEMDMVLPQIMTLEDIGHFHTVAEAIEASRKRNILPTLTKIKCDDDKQMEIMPDGSGYEGRPPVYSWPDKNDQ